MFVKQLKTTHSVCSVLKQEAVWVDGWTKHVGLVGFIKKQTYFSLLMATCQFGWKEDCKKCFTFDLFFKIWPNHNLMTTMLHYSCITLPHGRPVMSTVLAFTCLNITASMTLLPVYAEFKLARKDKYWRLIKEFIAFEQTKYRFISWYLCGTQKRELNLYTQKKTTHVCVSYCKVFLTRT